jgi:hypothetical protein
MIAGWLYEVVFKNEDCEGAKVITSKIELHSMLTSKDQ